MNEVISKAPGSWRVPAATAAVLAVVLAWDASGLDMAAASLFGSSHGFPWRDHWLFADLLHEGGRLASWLLALVLCLGVWWRFGVLRRIPLSRRLQLVVSAFAAATVVSLVKSSSATSCPWDMHDFGGVAHLVPHWRGWSVPDGGSGHCFPAGHASSGFAFLGGWFVFRAWPRVAQLWLAAAAGAGLLFGLAQQVRGAHFMSHTLWTGWICWAVAWGVDAAWPEVRA